MKLLSNKFCYFFVCTKFLDKEQKIFEIKSFEFIYFVLFIFLKLINVFDNLLL